MSLIKFARAEITGVKGSESRLGRTASLDHFADYDDYRTDDGYIYVRVRAISSRVNKNHDGWPSEELAKSFRTFLGKPIFVDHNNSDPERHRGVVVDAKLHVEEPGRTSALDPYYASAPSEHLPPTWIELLLETDAKTFPKLAKAITSGEIDGVSMGCNVERSKCSHCGNWASVPEQYCQHIREKGAEYDYFRDGKKTSKKSYEDCYDIGFFEISYVFDPADETALIREVRAHGMQKAAAKKTGEDMRDYGDEDFHEPPYDGPSAYDQPQAIKPHPDLQYMSPDTVAETVDGISPDTYGALWGIINSPDYKGAPIGGDRHDPYGEHGEPMVEDPASARDVMMGNKGDMASHFHKLTPEQQQEVNAALEAQNAGFDREGKTAGNPAAAARADKEAHPDQYCSKCLWKTGGGDCPRHGGPARGQDASGKDTGPVREGGSKFDPTPCKQCGSPMNPAATMVAGKNGVCGDCARKNHKEVTGVSMEPQPEGEGRPPGTFFEDPDDYADYLHHTLIPDLHASGSHETAQDFETIRDHIHNGTSDPGYEDWLRSTLIPDLHASGKEFTANDLEEGIHHMQAASDGGVNPMEDANRAYQKQYDEEHGYYNSKVAKTAEYDPDMGYMDHGDPIEEASCPMCGGPGMFIGTLGRRNHHRCRNCGMDFSDEGEAPEDHNNFEDPSGQPMPPRGAATAEAVDEDEDELAKYRKRFKEERGKSGDVTSGIMDTLKGMRPGGNPEQIGGQIPQPEADGPSLMNRAQCAVGKHDSVHLGPYMHYCRNCGQNMRYQGDANNIDPRYIPQIEQAQHTDANEWERLFDLASGKKSAKKKKHHHVKGGCPVCGARSIVWSGGMMNGQCQNCGNEVEPDGDADDAVTAAAAKCDHCGKPLDSAAKAEGNRVCSDCEKNWSTVQKAADTQQLPQSDLVHAPQDVNTLRQEQVCPVCGNQMEDGKCSVCGNETPPEGFGNPDLDKAQEVNQEQEAADMAQSGPGGQPPVPVDAGQGSPPPGPSPMGQPGAGASAMPLQAAASVTVSSDKTSANTGGAKGGQPILPATQQATDRPKNEKRIQDSSKPVESSSREETMTDKSKTSAPDNVADRLQSDRHRTQVADVEGEGGVISDENPIGHKNVSVDGVGAVDNDENPEGHKEESLDSSLKEEVGGPTKTWGKGEGDSLGQHSPVGGGGDSALASTKRSLQIFPVTDPKSVKLDAGLKEEVGPPTSTFGSDDFHITDPVTNEVFPTEGGVEPEGKGVPDKSPFPPAAEGVKAARRQFMASLRLAETEIALGLIPAEQKLDRMSELEGEATEAIEAQLAAYSKVKTAGLQKAAKKTGGSLPSLKRSSVEHESTIRQVEAHDETVELAESIFS